MRSHSSAETRPPDPSPFDPARADPLPDDPGELGGSALLDEILDDPERDRGSGARPIVSVREQEDAAFLAAVEARQTARVALSRRGVWHGEWAEVGEDGAAPPSPAALV